MTDDTRDRLIALEVEVRHLTDTLGDMGLKVDEMHGVMLQMKGARWALAAVWLSLGAVIASVPKLLALFGIVKP